jgi:hypothetical protein
MTINEYACMSPPWYILHLPYPQTAAKKTLKQPNQAPVHPKVRKELAPADIGPLDRSNQAMQPATASSIARACKNA